jgi:hypothetical protein
LKNEKLPRDNENSTAAKKAAILLRSPFRDAGNDKEATGLADDRSMQKKAPGIGVGPQSDVSRGIRPSAQLRREELPQESSKKAASAKVEQPLRDSDSVPKAEREEAQIEVTKVLRVRKLASEDSGKENSSSGEKVSTRDAGGQEGREDATKMLDVRQLATAFSAKSEDEAASVENTVSESASAETGGSQPAASRWVKIEHLTPFASQKEAAKSASALRPGSTLTHDPAVAAFEEPQMADDGDRTRFFQKPAFPEPVEHARNSSSQKALPLSNGPGEPASSPDLGPSTREAHGNKEEVAASPDHVAPVSHPAGWNGTTTGDFSAMVGINFPNSTRSLLVPLVLIQILCTAVLVIIVGALLINTLGGLPHVFSFFRR